MADRDYQGWLDFGRRDAEWDTKMGSGSNTSWFVLFIAFVFLFRFFCLQNYWLLFLAESLQINWCADLSEFVFIKVIASLQQCRTQKRRPRSQVGAQRGKFSMNFRRNFRQCFLWIRLKTRTRRSRSDWNPFLCPQASVETCPIQEDQMSTKFVILQTAKTTWWSCKYTQEKVAMFWIEIQMFYWQTHWHKYSWWCSDRAEQTVVQRQKIMVWLISVRTIVIKTCVFGSFPFCFRSILCLFATADSSELRLFYTTINKSVLWKPTKRVHFTSQQFEKSPNEHGIQQSCEKNKMKQKKSIITEQYIQSLQWLDASWQTGFDFGDRFRFDPIRL